MRVAPSTTLFLEQRNPNSQSVSLRQWELANQWVLEKIQTHAPVDVTAIINLHEILFPEREGIFRGSPVMGGNTDYPEPGGLDELWKRFSRLLETEERSAIVFASKVYQWLITLHFFADANGRLARLAADWILLKEGLVPMSFPDDVASFVSALSQENSLDPQGAVRLVCDAVERSTLILSR